MSELPSSPRRREDGDEEPMKNDFLESLHA
jgi:hypothetical protein